MMTWERKSDYRIESPEGYMVTRFRVQDRRIFVAWAPLEIRHLYVGTSADEARAACEKHLGRVANADQFAG
jgi:hypothetical protein